MLHSDQRQNFESTLFSKICSLLGIAKQEQLPYLQSPMAWLTIVTKLSKLSFPSLLKTINVTGTASCMHLPLLLMAYRAAVHESSGCTPASLMLAVLLYNPQRNKGKSPKLMRPWQGPCVVIKRINDILYHAQLIPGASQR